MNLIKQHNPAKNKRKVHAYTTEHDIMHTLCKKNFDSNVYPYTKFEGEIEDVECLVCKAVLKKAR